MFTTLIFLACSEKDTTHADTAEDGPDFQNEEHLVLESDFEQCGVYWHAGSDNMIEGAFAQISPPTYPYEIRGVSIQAFVSESFGCSPEGTIHLIAYVGEDPRRSEEIVSFMEYNTIAPYSFPELDNVVSATIALDSTSDPEILVEDKYEFTAIFDTPLLVENEEPLWIGFGIHDMENTCIAGCEANQTLLMARQGEILEEEDAAPNLGVVLGY